MYGHDGHVPDLEYLKERILEHCKPSRIYLFGSRAKGSAQADSDVDILVVWDEKPHLSPLSRQSMIRRFIGPTDYGLDLVVYTSEELSEALEDTRSFASQALKEAKPIYG